MITLKDNFSIRKAEALGAKRVILHTTKAMANAWSLYLKMGFSRCPELDFMQKALPVFGFELILARQGLPGGQEGERTWP